MKWYPLSALQIFILLVLVVLIDIFTVAMHPLPEILRPVLYLVVVIIVLLAYFFFIRPAEPMVLAATLAVILGIITLVLIIIQDVIIAHTLSWRTAIVLLGAVAGPPVAGYLYAKMRSPVATV